MLFYTALLVTNSYDHSGANASAQRRNCYAQALAHTFTKPVIITSENIEKSCFNHNWVNL